MASTIHARKGGRERGREGGREEGREGGREEEREGGKGGREGGREGERENTVATNSHTCTLLKCVCLHVSHKVWICFLPLPPSISFSLSLSAVMFDH